MARYGEEFMGKGASFLLRNAESTDAEGLFTFMEHVDRETTFLAREPGEFRESYTPEQERTLLDNWAKGTEKLFLVAEAENGEIAATCSCMVNEGRKRVRHKAEIAICVRQRYWRMGLGRKLLETQFGWCQSRGVERLVLEVDTQNTRALGLYLSLGFVVEGTLRRDAKMADGSYRDLYVMAKFFQ